MPPFLLDRVRARLLTPAGTLVNVAVGASATTLAVTWSCAEGSTAYGVLVQPSWLCTHSVTGKTTAGCTITFSVAPGGSGGTVDVFTFHPDA